MPPARAAAALLAVCLALAAGHGAGAAPTAPAGDALDALLAGRVIPLRSIAPDDEDFSDLEPLAARLGGARVVQLGENTHGDGSTFLAKARLIRFLHQRLGFDVLAIESGFFDVRDVAAGLRGTAPLAEVAARGLYKVWAGSREVEPTLAYLRATQATVRPLDLVGFDCRVATESARREGFPAYVEALFDRLDPTLLSASERTDLRAMSRDLVPAEHYAHPGPRAYNRDLVRRLIAALDGRGAEFARRESPGELAYARQSLVSLLAMDRALPPDPERPSPGGYSRDAAMAENLLWWLRGPLADRKVIVWAHNYHVGMAWVGGHEVPADRPFAGTLGHHLARALGRELYTVGFLAHHGSFHYANGPGDAIPPETIPTPAAGSLEARLHGLGKPYLWLDFNDLPADSPLRQPLTASALFYEPAVAVWPRLYDAFVFLDAMQPSSERGR